MRIPQEIKAICDAEKMKQNNESTVKKQNQSRWGNKAS